MEQAKIVLAPKIIATIRGMRLVPYSQIAATTMLVYDWALTLDMEINLVWKKKWNLLKCIYLFQRYIVILDCALPLYRQAGSAMTDIKCNRLKPPVMVFTVLGTLTSEAILTIRVWAIRDRDRKLLIILCTIAAMVWVPGIVTLYLFFTNIRYAPAPPYEGHKGCFPLKGSPYIIWWWAALCMWDFVCLTLVLKPALNFFQSNMRSRLSMSLVVYRDGVLFYIFLFLCSLFNVVAYATFPLALRAMGTALTRCLHSMLASRALLQMREQLQQPASTTDFFPSAFLFNSTNTNTIELSEVNQDPNNSHSNMTDTNNS